MSSFHPSIWRRIVLSSGQTVEYTDPITVYEVLIIPLIYMNNINNIYFQTFGDGINSSGVISLNVSLSFSSIGEAAITFVNNYLGLSAPTGVAFTSGYKTGKMTYAYVTQTDDVSFQPMTVHDLVGNWIDNSFLRAAPLPMRWQTLHGRVILLLHSAIPLWKKVCFTDNFYPPCFSPTTESAADTSSKIPISHAISTAENYLNGTHTGHPTSTQYLATPNGHLALVHAIQIENNSLGTHYEAFVDAHSGQLLSLTDFVCNASVSS